jgi:biofilm protein TabA
MIVDQISNYHLYNGANKKVDKAIQYIINNNFQELKKGMHEIEGDELFFNLIEYETKKAEERFWESHKKYIDIHYLLEGEEFVGYDLFERMTISVDYNEADDYYLLEGSLHSKVKLQKGDFMICYPNDVHMTGIISSEPKSVRKIVFKVKI